MSDYLKDSDILVSVICTAYNHEQYIERAIQGFLAQQTTFGIEIIINDDASLDSTAEIILAYAKKYPAIIKPIIQKQNQYSKGVIISREIMLPQAKGKYIALCEGDDYWIDPQKLQKQIDFLENNNEYTFSFTNAILDYNGVKNRRKKIAIPWNKYEKYYYNPQKKTYSFHEFVKMVCIPTASFVIKAEIFRQIPRLPNNCFQGDRYIELFCVSQGPAYFLNECTCAYRKNVENSITAKWKKIKVGYGELNPITLMFLNMYDCLDTLTNGCFTKDIDFLRVQSYILYALLTKDKFFLKNNSKNVKDIALKSGYKMIILYYLSYVPFSEYLFKIYIRFKKIL